MSLPPKDWGINPLMTYSSAAQSFAFGKLALTSIRTSKLSWLKHETLQSWGIIVVS